MKNKKDSMILIICALLLLISVSYSWMLNKGAQTTRRIVLDQSGESRMTISSSTNIRMDVLYLNKTTGKYEEWNPEDLVSLKLFEDVVPGESIKFKLRFRNFSGMTQKMRLSVGGIKNTVSDADVSESLVPYMYINVTPGDGFKNTIDGDVDIPDQIFRSMYEDVNFENGSGSFTLYDSITIPDTGAENSGAYAELDCYFWLDHQTPGEYQDKSMNVEYFRLTE